VVNQFNREVFWDLWQEKVSGVNIYGGAVGVVIARQSASSDDCQVPFHFHNVADGEG
jgi:hypothetical protein